MTYELESIYNRSKNLIESLHHLGLYLKNNGAYYRLIVKTKLGNVITPQVYMDAKYAMRVLSQIAPTVESDIKKDTDYRDRLKKHIKKEKGKRWLRRIFKRK